jgi:hypothetical protein
MADLSTLIKQGRNEDIWNKYCGFLDLNLDEFMEIQERLLIEQIHLLGNSVMGRMLLGDNIPTSIKEFREKIPLTTYSDYIGYLDDQREDVLPRKPVAWAHTSGRSGEYRFKWVPYTKEMYEKIAEGIIGAMIISNCSRRYEINLEVNDAVLLATAPPPYISGILIHAIAALTDFEFLPPIEMDDKLEFRERMTMGFSMAIKQGVDFFYGIASVLVRVGEQFEEGGGSTKPSLDLLRPDVLFRLVKGAITARIKNTPMLPKYLWNLKGILTGGTDTSIYLDKIEHYWGRRPLEMYGLTEAGVVGTQTWNRVAFTFLPDMAFWEFIPHEDHLKSLEDPDFKPKTVLYNELKPGIYEMVHTNFHGGIFTRYRAGDLVRVLGTRDEETNVNLPQIRFWSRARDIINLGGMVLLTEKDIWQAIENTKIEYYDWVARKEGKEGKEYLHLFIELDTAGKTDVDSIAKEISHCLNELNPDYHSFLDILGYDPIKVTYLNPGAFGAYMDYMESEGADLAHTKPPHMKPDKDQMNLLMKGKRLSKK